MYWSQLLDVTKGRYSELPAVPPIAAAISATATTAAATTAAAATAATATRATAAATTTTTTTLRTLFSFVHAQRTPVDHLAVHAFDRALCLLVGPHRDEREATGLSRRAIGHDVYVRHFTERSECSTHRFGVRMKRQVPDVQTISHDHFLLSLRLGKSSRAQARRVVPYRNRSMSARQ
jgi:hypothetical protein